MKRADRKIVRVDEDVPPLDDVLAFMRLMWAVDHALQRTSKRMKATLGVTGPQRLVVRIVGKFPGLSATQLAGFLYIHPSTLTGVLKRLERQGLIRCRPDPRDRRRRLLGLTARGRLVDSQMNGTVEAAVRATMHTLRAAEFDAARKVLETIVKRLEAS
jgi:DNA-binding MarR family transcriptional regulator